MLMLLTTNKGLFAIQLMLIICIQSGISDLYSMPDKIDAILHRMNWQWITERMNFGLLFFFS